MSTHRFDWHAEDHELAAYLDGEGAPVVDASLEAHLMACAECREKLAHANGDVGRDQAWERLADAIDRPTATTLQRLTFGRATPLMAIATPKMVRAALVAVAIVGLIPLAVAALAGESAVALLLTLAPMAPAAAVVFSYRDGSDPAGEISLATPSAGLRLVAMRTLVVSLAALPVSVGVVWLADLPIRLAFAWCLPGIALAGLILLVGTTGLDPLRAAVALSALWAFALAIPGTDRSGPRPERVIEIISNPALQTTALVVAVAALLVTVVRRDAVAYRRIA